MDEIIDSYLISQEFATLIANADCSGLSDEDLCDFTHWEGNVVEDNEYLVVSDNDETVWHICDVTGYYNDCIRVNKLRIR